MEMSWMHSCTSLRIPLASEPSSPFCLHTNLTILCTSMKFHVHCVGGKAGSICACIRDVQTFDQKIGATRRVRVCKVAFFFGKDKQPS